MVNENIKLITENKKPVEIVHELKDEYKIPSYEEFMKDYNENEKAIDNYELEVDSYGDIREPKKSGPMFNFLQAIQVLLNTPAGPVVEVVGQAGGSSLDVGRVLTETGRFAAEHSNEFSNIGRIIGENIRDGASSSLSVFNAAASCVLEYKTLWDWWANGITGEERQTLLSLGFSDRGSTYSLQELKEVISFCDWSEREVPITFSKVDGYDDFLYFKKKYFSVFKKENLPGEGDDWVKLKGDQGWRSTRDNTIWKKDKFHGDHWDVSDRKGNKIKEIDFYGRQIWPSGPKNKNKRG